MSIPPILMCIALSTLVGSGCVFALAVVNGMRVLGKK